jgi:hypothetical protein
MNTDRYMTEEPIDQLYIVVSAQHSDSALSTMMQSMFHRMSSDATVKDESGGETHERHNARDGRHDGRYGAQDEPWSDDEGSGDEE